MALYDSSTMRLLGGVPGQQLFLYRSADSINSIAASGYFNSAVAEYNLSTGDMILVVSGFGGTPVFDGLVAAVASGTVTTSLLS